jgi:hypothetical protein
MEKVYEELKNEVRDYTFKYLVDEEPQLRRSLTGKMRAFKEAMLWTGHDAEKFVSLLTLALDRNDHMDIIDAAKAMEEKEVSIRRKMNLLSSLLTDRCKLIQEFMSRPCTCGRCPYDANANKA